MGYYLNWKKKFAGLGGCKGRFARVYLTRPVYSTLGRCLDDAPHAKQPCNNRPARYVYPTFRLLWPFTTVTFQPCNVLLPWHFIPVTFCHCNISSLGCFTTATFNICNVWHFESVTLHYYDILTLKWNIQATDVHPASKVASCHCARTSTFVTELWQDIHFCSEAECGHFVACHQDEEAALALLVIS